MGAPATLADRLPSAGHLPRAPAGVRLRHALAGAGLVAATVAMVPAAAALSSEELAKLAQNPVGNLVSVPFQNNTNFNTGPREGTQNVLNIQPVVPVELNSEWNLITRTIVPVITQPGFTPGQDQTTGIGDTSFTAFLSPAQPKSLIWGVGPVVQIPTNSNDRLGNGNWGLGPSFVVLHLDKGDPWVYGVLVNNVWSLSSSRQGGSYNNGLIQPFINYNFPGGTYLTSSPIATVNWKADGGQKWTLPIGGGIGRIFHFGRLPVNMQLSAYYNVVHPDDGPNWQLRAQVQLMFPK
ncbi:neuromedin U [Accumulibacter sp.]|uniref:neuromedin U n=1 Tax=Accumulibacter sp. TaxID=2053492 RepID=UPI0025F23F06|nr:neuromedin U [Accumulibacter sp.]MCM8612011.1 transporter [Accumulibacter sp.]MCM8635980.1 transporter [Accumulibacter sp.]MCM8641855.1 transporter [Accumulibacter sp.]